MSNIESITFIEDGQTYDLEVNHKDHQFYLANGVLTSNSHAITYSMISYHTAYLKAHYPIEFLLANLMAEVGSTTPDAKSNIQKIKKELKQHRIKIIPPDINKSDRQYKIVDNKLITGLDAIKHVGEEAILDVLEKRPFKSFHDFMLRADSSKVRANVIQAFIASGCFDSFNLSRKSMFLYCSDYRKKLKDFSKKHNPFTEQFTYPWENSDEWSDSQLFALEDFYLEESFICKPYEAYEGFFDINHIKIADLKKAKDKTQIPHMRAIIRDFFEFKVKKEGSRYFGQPMIKAVIEDMNREQISCTIFPDRWKNVQERLKFINSKSTFDKGLAIAFNGSVNEYDGEKGLILDQIFDISMFPKKPDDLKAKKVSMKKSKIVDAPCVEDNLETLVEELEDNLYDDGLIDLDEELN